MMNATTPRKANMSAHNSPSKSPSRRVLGDLTPKAINTPSKQINSLEHAHAMKAYSPLKRTQTLSPQLFKNKENITNASPHQSGRKRSIYEVEDAENVENARKVMGARDESMETTEMPVTAVALATLQGPDDVDVDADLVGSPTEPDTPTPEPEEDQVEDSQKSNQSFSMFVDYNACDSQPAEHAAAAAEVAKKASRADLLRLRLGFAQYKVKTNQVSRSGSEILSSWETTTSASSNSTAPVDSTTSSSSNPPRNIPSITLSPARHEQSVTHVTANLDPGRSIPKLSGGPVLMPTAYSSRMIHDYHMPSSPPDGPPDYVSPENLTSPTRRDYRTPNSKRMRGSTNNNDEEAEDGCEPEAMDEDEDDTELTIQQRLQRQRERNFGLGDLTSSAVKGNAAKGLLELMAGRR